jgi:diguanylate cyclase (GGDEF)-like protein/PAS domain S-box-containing protein
VARRNEDLDTRSGRRSDDNDVERGRESEFPSSVLVIDDSPSDRALIREILKEVDAGIEVTASASLKEALEAITATTFELILLDLGLPDADELEGLLILVDRLPTTPIVVVTAHPGDSFIYQALNHGADEYLSKTDLSPERVSDVVRRSFLRRAGRRRYDRFNMSAARALNMILTPAVALAVTGQIVATNGAWDLEAFENGGTPEGTGVGANYLAVCRRAVGDDTFGALEVATGIESVLAGTRENFSFDYPCSRLGIDYWFNVRVVPLANSGNGAVVTHVDVTTIRGAEQELGRRHSLLRTSNDAAHASLYAKNSEIFALIDADGKVLHASESTRRILGGSRLNSKNAEALGRVDPLDVERVSGIFERLVALPGASEAVTLRMIDREDHQRSLDLTITNLLQDSSVHAIVVSGSDVTKSRNRQIAGRIATRLLDSLPASVVVTDYSGTIVYWNQRASSLYGYSSEEVVGRTIKELRLRPGTETTIDAVVMTSGRWEGDVQAYRADNTTVWVHVIVERVESPDIDFEGIVSSAMDVSERRRLEESLLHQSRFDPVTDLPNRRHFIERVDRVLRTKSEGDDSLALLFIDFDDFWAINDSFGYEFGTEALVEWSKLVKDRLSPNDFLAHLGGDEFAICCDSLTSAGALMEFIREIRDINSGVVEVQGQSVSFTTTIGVALSVATSTAEGLLRNADSAMYAAKEIGKAQISIFDEGQHESLRVRNALRLELAKAVEDDKIVAYFQPEVSLDTGKVVGFEALARWDGQDSVTPAEFIPLAEDSGLIGRIGLRMLRASCEALQRWKSSCPDKSLSIAVNVSALQLLDPTFPGSVRSICSEFDIDPTCICLEITESALGDEVTAFHALHELKAIGVLIAIDDFGTGYSSLLRLQRYPLDVIKIDLSFVAELKIAKRDPVVISAILGIASALEFRTVGEGIENELQWQRLLEMGCEVGQGYLFSKAVTFEEASLLVETDAHFTRGDGGSSPVAA